MGKTTLMWDMLISHTLALTLIITFTTADYQCLCNYNVELRAFSNTTKQAMIIGYLYEFDCKPTYKAKHDKGWQAIQINNQVGFVYLDGQTKLQICPGDPSIIDIVTTTASRPGSPATTTLSMILTTEVGSTHTAAAQTITAAVPNTPNIPSVTYTPSTNTTASLANSSSTNPATTLSITPITRPITAYTTTYTNMATTMPLSASTIISTATTTTPSTTATTTTTTPTTTPTSTTSLKTRLATTTTTMPSTTTTTMPITASITTATTEATTTPSPGTTTTPTRTQVATETTTPTTTPTTGTTTTPTTTRITTKTTTPTTKPSTGTTTTPTTTRITTKTTTPTTKPSTGTTTMPTTTPTTTPSTVTTTTPTTTPITTPSTTTRATPTILPTTTPYTIPTSHTTTSKKYLCPGGVPLKYTIQHGNYCYQLYPYQTKDWMTAESYCESHNGSLVVISQKEIQTTLMLLLLKLNYRHPVWIGLHDIRTEGTWEWIDGTLLSHSTYENWRPGHVDRVYHNEEDCAILDPNTGRWDDVVCKGFLLDKQRHPWICQYKIS